MFKIERGRKIMNAPIFDMNTVLKLSEKRSKMLVNLNKLHEYSQLEYNWNDNRAEPFEKELINLAWKKINELEIQPDVFPTACDSIQFEYEKENEDYLEFEIYTDRIEVFRIIGENKEGFDLPIDEDLNKIVNEFHRK